MEQRVFSHFEKDHFKSHFTSVLLYSSPCMNRGKCKFCNYWTDSVQVKDIYLQVEENSKILSTIDWRKLSGVLSISPSASFSELPAITILELQKLIIMSEIDYFISEFYWEYYKYMEYFYINFLEYFNSKRKIFKVGMETFDTDFRKYLGKDYGDVSPLQVRKYFNGINMLVGVQGQTKEMILEDLKKIEIFDYVDINLFDVEQGKLRVDADKELIRWFLDDVEVPQNCKVWKTGNEYLGL